MKNLLRHSLLLTFAFAALTLTGCAWWNQMGASSTEQLLTAAGFQVRPVDTPQKQAVMNSLTPYEVQMRSKGGRVYYVYPDTKQNIVYVGGPSQYQAYQKALLKEEEAEDQMAAASEMQMMSMDEYSMWDPFW